MVRTQTSSIHLTPLRHISLIFISVVPKSYSRKNSGCISCIPILATCPVHRSLLDFGVLASPRDLYRTQCHSKQLTRLILFIVQVFLWALHFQTLIIHFLSHINREPSLPATQRASSKGL